MGAHELPVPTTIEGVMAMPCLYKAHVIEWLEKVKDDEPLFVMRAQDLAAPDAVELWAQTAEGLGAPENKVAHARLHADAMRAWGGAKKVPD